MFKRGIGRLLAFSIVLAGIIPACKPEAPRRGATTISFSGKIPGALVATDGRLLSPELRRYPALREPLNPKGRWMLPEDILAEIPGGQYLELRSVDAGAGSMEQIVAPTLALPRWRVPFLRTALAQTKGEEPEKVIIRYLAGPRGTPQAEIRWDGKVLATLNTSQPAWELKAISVALPESKESGGFRILDLVNSDHQPFDPKSLPSAFFLTGLEMPDSWKYAGVSGEIGGASGNPMLLPLAPGGDPVRLWTLGYANNSSPEFVPVGETGNETLPAPEKALADGNDAGLKRVEFSIERNPDGSQVEDFRKAVRFVVPKVEARLNQALSLTILFDAPEEGTAQLVGRGEAKGKWRLEINGTKIPLPSQPAGNLHVDNIPVTKGRNSLSIIPDTGRVSWDWLGLDLIRSDFMQSSRPVEGRPLAPPAGREMTNPPIVIDAETALQLSGISSIQPEIFGINDHNGINYLNNSEPFFESVKAMNIGSIKGADGVMGTTAPKNKMAADKLDDYYKSTVPLEQWKAWFWNANDLAVMKTTKALGAKRIVVGSSLPAWSKLSSSDWNMPPEDFSTTSRMIVGGLRTVQQIWPELAYMYVWNEPDAGWWRADKQLKTEKGMGYGEYFQAYIASLKKALMETNTNIKLGAPSTLNVPVSSAAGETLVDRWDVWWEPMIRDNWDNIDFMDFHFYGLDPREILANLDLLAGMGDTLHAERKPVSITEANYAEPVFTSYAMQSEPDCWRYRSLPYARFLIAMAGQPDRVWTTMCHDLLAHEYGLYFHGGLEPTSLVDVFHALAPLRGTLLGTSASNPDFSWTASRNENDLVIAIVTSERNGGSLRVVMPEKYTGPADVIQLRLNGERSDVEALRTKVEVVNGRIELPPMPGSLIVLKYGLPEGSKVEKAIVRADHFSDTMMRVLDHRNPSLSCKIHYPVAGREGRYRLRVGSFGSAVPGDFDFFWNGQPISLASRYFDEVEISPDSVRVENEFLIKAKDPSRKRPFIFGTVSLISEMEAGNEAKNLEPSSDNP